MTQQFVIYDDVSKTFYTGRGWTDAPLEAMKFQTEDGAHAMCNVLSIGEVKEVETK